MLMTKCERCGNVVDMDKRFFLPHLTIGNSPQDICDRCWEEFKHWWNNVIREREKLHG